MINVAKDWVVKRFKERTSWDGAILIAVGVGYLVIEPIGTVIAYGAIVYGAWTIWKEESL